MMSTDKTEQALPPSEDREVLEAFIKRAGFPYGWENLESQARRMARHAVDEIAALTAAPPAQPQSEPAGNWEGAEEWMPLAWELCAEECGEDACNELVWEGGPVPEPWGERWLKYEDEAKRLIALVRKRVPLAAQPPERAAQQEAQERAPVAYVDPHSLAWLAENPVHRLLQTQLRGVPFPGAAALYAAPPIAVEPMQALTDEQVTAMVDGFIRGVAFNRGVAVEIGIRVIRAYEAARGIGKQEES